MEKDTHKEQGMGVVQSTARAEAICEQIEYDRAVSQAWEPCGIEDEAKDCYEHCAHALMCERAYMVQWPYDPKEYPGCGPEDIWNKLDCINCEFWEEP